MDSRPMSRILRMVQARSKTRLAPKRAKAIKTAGAPRAYRWMPAGDPLPHEINITAILNQAMEGWVFNVMIQATTPIASPNNSVITYAVNWGLSPLIIDRTASAVLKNDGPTAR